MSSASSTAPLLLTLSGGVGASISGSVSTVGIVDNTLTQTVPLIWTSPLFYFSSLPTQIAGFVPLWPCNYSDCRAVPQRDCIPIKVFGNQTGNISTYQNDMNSFFVSWNGYAPQFVIQQQQSAYFGAKTNLDTWQTVATITNNTYGLYYPYGTIANNPLWAAFTVNWGAVVAAFGTGIYKIAVNGCTEVNGTQATVSFTIPSTGFPQAITGTFFIGTLALTLNYNGTYTGYLAYLIGLINASSKYTASVSVSNVITIVGTNYNLSNGLVVKQSINTTTGNFSVQVGSQAITGTGTPTIDNNPQLFNTVNYNIGSSYNTGTGEWTCPISLNGKNVGFSGSIQARSNNNAGYPVNMRIIANIYKNGTFLLGQSLFPNGNPYAFGTLNYSFPLIVNTGDNIKIEFYLQGISPNANNSKTVTLDKGTFIASSTPSFTNTTLGTLSGGVAATTTCVCALETPEFELMNWNCDLARGTAKWESYITGTFGSALYQGTIYTFNGFTMYDSIRTPGFFGYWEPKYDKVINEWGVSLSEQLGTMDLVRDKIVPNWKFKGFLAPLWMWKNLAYYGFMANASKRLLVSDYNFNNSDWNIIQKSIIAKSDFKPTYLNPGNFPADETNIERQLSIEVAFEDGIQSGIMSQFNIY